MPSVYIPHAPSLRQLPPGCVILLFGYIFSTSHFVIFKFPTSWSKTLGQFNWFTQPMHRAEVLHVPRYDPMWGSKNTANDFKLVQLFQNPTCGPRWTVNLGPRGMRLVEKVQLVLICSLGTFRGMWSNKASWKSWFGDTPSASQKLHETSQKCNQPWSCSVSWRDQIKACELLGAWETSGACLISIYSICFSFQKYVFWRDNMSTPQKWLEMSRNVIRHRLFRFPMGEGWILCGNWSLINLPIVEDLNEN